MRQHVDIYPLSSMDFYPLAKWTVIHNKMTMAKSFRDALIEGIASSGVSVAELARATGVSKDQIHKVKQGKSRSTNVDDALKIANYFGQSLDEFLEDSSTQKDAEIASLLMQLEPTERQFLLNAAKAQIDARNHSSPAPDEEPQ